MQPLSCESLPCLVRSKGTGAGSKPAAAFIDFVALEEGQKITWEFGKAQYGKGFYDDAAHAPQCVEQKIREIVMGFLT